MAAQSGTIAWVTVAGGRRSFCERQIARLKESRASMSPTRVVARLTLRRSSLLLVALLLLTLAGRWWKDGRKG